MNRIFFSFGGLTIYWYSITMLLGVLTGIFIATHEAKKQHQSEYFENLLFYLIIFGIIGARLYYAIFEFDKYKYDLLSIFKVWEGGLAIYGAIIAGTLVVLYYSKKHKKQLLNTTDIITPGLIVGQAIGRWGNFFNQEAHGTEVTLEFLKNLHLPDFIIDGMYIDGTYYHPTFFYESSWCILGFILLLLIRKYIKQKDGTVTFCYLIWYGIGRLLIEGLRTDSLYLGNIRVSQLVSIVIILIGLIGIITNLYKTRKEVKK